MVAAAELRAKYGAPLTESDGEGIPASIREKSPNIGRADEKLNPRPSLPLCVQQKKDYRPPLKKKKKMEQMQRVKPRLGRKLAGAAM